MTLTWTQWVEWHCGLFGFAETQRAMLLAWTALLVDGGFRPAELFELSSELKMIGAPTVPWMHFSALMGLAKQRARIGLVIERLEFLKQMWPPH